MQKFLEPDRNPKVIYTDISLEFGKSCEEVSWNHCTSTPHRLETSGIAERAVRRVKEGTSAVLLQSGLDKSWWADSMECYSYLRHVTDLLSDGKTPNERRFGQPLKGPIIPFGSLVEYHPTTAKDQYVLVLVLHRRQCFNALVSQGRESRETRCRKSWDRFEEYDSLSLRFVKASIQEKKGHSLGKIQVKNPHQRGPNAMKFEDWSHEETERQERCAQSRAWNLAKKHIQAQRKRQGCFLLARGRVGTPGCVNRRAGGKKVCGGFRS